MTDATSARLRPLADTSPSAVVAGFIAMLTGYTSSLVLMFQAGQAAGLTTAQISSWIWALSIGMAVCNIGLSLRYRTPVTVAWSTPGAALLITSLGGVSYGEAIGAYITCAVLCGNEDFAADLEQDARQQRRGQRGRDALDQALEAASQAADEHQYRAGDVGTNGLAIAHTAQAGDQQSGAGGGPGHGNRRPIAQRQADAAHRHTDRQRPDP